MSTDTERREVAARLRGLRPGACFDDVYEALGAYGPSPYESRGLSATGLARHLADLIEPHRGSGGKTILCAHCESASWCGCESGDEEGGCDFEPRIDEGEPPYNLYSLYEAVFRRRPRDEFAIEDDEVRELVNELLDICNAPGHDLIKACDASQGCRDTVASDPTERGIDSIYDWCFAAIEGADGAEDELYCSIMRAIEDYRHPERATAHTVRAVDRDALLALADDMRRHVAMDERSRCHRWVSPEEAVAYADRIREALGVVA